MRLSGTISVRFNFAAEKVAILLGFLQPCRFQVPSSAPIGTGGYSYYYNGDTIKIFFEYDEIEERMKSIFPKSEDEKFIVEVYEKYKKFENTTSVFEKGISFKEPKVINV